MKQHIVTQGIVLARTDFQEADRILTVLTSDNGKVRAIAKGVRRPKSKLAGGIELLSVSELTFMPSRGELQTLISSRLMTHYANIVKDIKRTMLAYEILKRINRMTEDDTEEAYFDLLQSTLQGLNNLELDIALLELWFAIHLLSITGHTPNLKTDTEGTDLSASESYSFDYDEMAFRQQAHGPYNANHIKLLRLTYATNSPILLRQLKDASDSTDSALKLVSGMLELAFRR